MANRMFASVNSIRYIYFGAKENKAKKHMI